MFTHSRLKILVAVATLSAPGLEAHNALCRSQLESAARIISPELQKELLNILNGQVNLGGGGSMYDLKMYTITTLKNYQSAGSAVDRDAATKALATVENSRAGVPEKFREWVATCLGIRVARKEKMGWVAIPLRSAPGELAASAVIQSLNYPLSHPAASLSEQLAAAQKILADYRQAATSDLDRKLLEKAVNDFDKSIWTGGSNGILDRLNTSLGFPVAVQEGAAWVQIYYPSSQGERARLEVSQLSNLRSTQYVARDLSQIRQIAMTRIVTLLRAAPSEDDRSIYQRAYRFLLEGKVETGSDFVSGLRTAYETAEHSPVANASMR